MFQPPNSPRGGRPNKNFPNPLHRHLFAIDPILVEGVLQPQGIRKHLPPRERLDPFSVQVQLQALRPPGDPIVPRERVQVRHSDHRMRPMPRGHVSCRPSGLGRAKARKTLNRPDLQQETSPRPDQKEPQKGRN